jgi:hypothetical protein
MVNDLTVEGLIEVLVPVFESTGQLIAVQLTVIGELCERVPDLTEAEEAKIRENVATTRKVIAMMELATLMSKDLL